MTKFSAVVSTAPNEELEVVERSLEQLERAGGELVKVVACGVCYSDIVIAEGGYGDPYPLVLGHEIVGTHGTLGNVLVYAPWGCRKPKCRQCAQGLEMICAEGHDAGVVEDGGYAEYIRVPNLDYLLPIGDRDPFTTAPLACAGLTAYRAVKRALPFLQSEDSSVLIVGAGGVGQYSIQILKVLSTCSITVSELNLEKRFVAQQHGADFVVDRSVQSREFDVIIDCVGSKESLADSLESIRTGGMVLVAGFGQGRVPFGVGTQASEASISSTIMGSLQELKDLLAFSDEHPLSLHIENRPLSDAAYAHQKLREGKVKGRIVLDPQLSAVAKTPSPVIKESEHEESR